MKFVPGITQTLRQMMLQLFFLDSLGIAREEMKLPSVRQSAVVCKRYKAAKGLVLSRGPAQAQRDSGWLIGCLDEDHNTRMRPTSASCPIRSVPRARPDSGMDGFPEGC